MPGTTRCRARWPTGPAETLLTGRLTIRTFAGRPNFTSIRQGDQPERAFILILDHPVEVKSALDPADDERGVHTIQVMRAFTGDEKEEGGLARLVTPAIGREVVVEATLSHGTTAHHHTAVLGDIRQLKRRGARGFPALPHLDAAERAVKVARELERRETQLRGARIVDGADPAAVFDGYTRFVGTLVERRVPPVSPDEDRRHVRDGVRPLWVLQLDHPITLHKQRGRAIAPPLADVREIEVDVRFDDPLARRELRALGIEAEGPWDVALQPLFGKRYAVVGRLFTINSFQTPTRLAVDGIKAAPAPP